MDSTISPEHCFQDSPWCLPYSCDQYQRQHGSNFTIVSTNELLALFNSVLHFQEDASQVKANHLSHLVLPLEIFVLRFIVT